MTVFTQTSTDGVSCHDVRLCAWALSLAGGQARLYETLQVGRVVALSQGVSIGVVKSYAFQAGAAIDEFIRLQMLAGESLLYHQVVTQHVALRESLLAGIPRALTDGVTLADTRVVVQALAVINRLRVQDTAGGLAKYGVTLAQALRLHGALAAFFGRSAEDTLGMSSTLIEQFQATARLVEGASLGEVLGPTLFLRLDLEEGLDVADAKILKMIYAGDPLVDRFRVTAAYVDPGGGFTTWAINTRTGAVTEYQNYAFNSIAKMGNRFIGADDSGLWALDGAQDDTANIQTRIKSGLMQLGGSRFTSFKAAYLGLRVKDDATDFILKLHAGDGREYVYAVRPQNMATTKVNMGKGLRSRYFAFELVTAGSDYDLDSIEFVPIVSQRRV